MPSDPRGERAGEGGMIWTPELIGKMVAMSDTGMTTAAISEILGCTRNAVIGRLRRARDAIARPEPLMRRPLPRETISEMWSRGCTAAQIADAVGSTERSIASFVRKNRDICPNKTKAQISRIAKLSTVTRRASPPPRKIAPPSFDAGSFFHTAGRRLVSVAHGECLYAVNDAGVGEEHLFCGASAEGSWCAFHRSLVYQPAGKASRQCLTV